MAEVTTAPYPVSATASKPGDPERPVALADDSVRSPRVVVQWLCGDGPGAKEVVAKLIEDAGFVPVDLGGTAGCAVMEAPCRPGAVYGEEYRRKDAMGVAEAVRAARPIPPTPQYRS